MENNTSNTPENGEVTLSGNMGVGAILFSVLAWAAPLLVVAGQMPTILAYARNATVLGYGIVMVLVLFFAVGFATMTKYVENPGAYYAYITAGLGKCFGLGAGILALITYLAMQANFVAFGVFLRSFIADVCHGPMIPWFVLAIAGAVLVGLVAHFHIDVSAKVLGLFMLCEFAIIIIYDFTTFFKGGANGLAVEPFTISGMSSGNIGIALMYGTLCFIGFESTAIYREEAREPEKTIPKATYIAVLLIGCFYLFSAWMLITGAGADRIMTLTTDEASTLFTDLCYLMVGSTLPKVATIFTATSTFACVLSIHNAIARYAYSLSKDGIIPKLFSKVHPTQKSPYVASWLATAWDVILILILTVVYKFDVDGGIGPYSVFMKANGVATLAVILIIIMVNASVIIYFNKTKPELGQQIGKFKTVIAPILGGIGFIIVEILAIINITEFTGAPVGISVVLALLVFVVFGIGYFHARNLKTKKPEVYARIGRQ